MYTKVLVGVVYTSNTRFSHPLLKNNHVCTCMYFKLFFRVNTRVSCIHVQCLAVCVMLSAVIKIQKIAQ